MPSIGIIAMMNAQDPTAKPRSRRRRILKWSAIALVLLLAGAYGFLSMVAGGPKNVYGLVRYALPNMHRGDLRIGDRARDAKLYALDGTNTFHLRDRIGTKPLVLVFGSYT